MGSRSVDVNRAESERFQATPRADPITKQDIELDAWMASVVMESKATGTPAETIQVIEASDDVPVSRIDTMGEPQGDQHITMTSLEIESSDYVPGSSVDTMGEPQGDQHITMSSSLVVEASSDVPVSTTMSTSTAMIVEGTPTAI